MAGANTLRVPISATVGIYEDGYFVEGGARMMGSYDYLAAASEQVARGVMPPLDNGFGFVIDRRPAGRETDRIPAGEYTAYFAKHQIPLSPPDHAEHTHDMGHVYSYQRMFAKPEVAELASASAANALSSPELCKEFTGGMDGLGDCMRNLTDDSLNGQQPGRSDVRGARLSIKRLIAVRYAGQPEDAARDRAAYEAVEAALGLDGWYARATDRIQEQEMLIETRYREPADDLSAYYAALLGNSLLQGANT